MFVDPRGTRFSAWPAGARAPAAGIVATGAALAAALLNAAFGLGLAGKVNPFIRLYVLPRASVDAATTEGAST